MAPKHRRVASGTTRSASPPSPAPKTVTIVPPTISAEAITSSKTPSYLKFPLVVIISFSLSAFAHNIFHAITGDRLNVVSPDGNPQWQLYATVAWRVTELAVGWFGGYDAHDILSLSLMVHLPRLFLLHTYYALPLLPLYTLQLLQSASIVLPTLLLRPLSILHPSTFSPPTSDPTTTFTTSLLSTLTYTLPYLFLTLTGLLPRFLATHFTYLKTLELAHATTLPGVAILLAPLGYAATRFYLPAAASPFSAAAPTTYILDAEFDPITASLSQTLHRNLLWHLYLPQRSQEVLKRITTAGLLTLAAGAFWIWVEIEGTEAVGAVGWASVWATGAVLTGAVMGWVGGLGD